MKYSLTKGRRGRRSPVRGDPAPAADPTGTNAPAERPIQAPDPSSLALALDRLTREVLQSHRPLEEAWEQLRREVVAERRR